MIAVRRHLESFLALAPDVVQLHQRLHQLLHPLLAHANTARQQLLPDARPAVGATVLDMHGLDVHQQRVVAQAATLGTACFAHGVLVLSGHAGLQYPALHRDRPHLAVPIDKGVLPSIQAQHTRLVPLSLFPKYRAPFSRAPAWPAAG